MSLMSLIAMTAAALRAIFHLVPALFPLFTPGERSATDRAGFSRQIRFGTLAGHKAGVVKDVKGRNRARMLLFTL